MSTTMTLVFIRNLEVLARIGVHGHEHGKPQPVRINVWLTCKTRPENDKLETVVDYEKVADSIRAIVAAGHINLAESLAERIAASCLEDKRVEKARIRVEKLHALPGTESAGVEIERTR
jgi:dihydroneopterin aldolase